MVLSYVHLFSLKVVGVVVVVELFVPPRPFPLTTTTTRFIYTTTLRMLQVRHWARTFMCIEEAEVVKR